MDVKGHVLIIDDDHALLALLKDVLILHGYKADVAKNGLDGLGMLNNCRYDAIISDIEMPIMDGIGFYNSLVAENPCIKGKVIFITSSTDVETERFIGETGCHYFFKPFKIDEFLKVVDEVCISGQTHKGRERRQEKRISSETECLIINSGYADKSISATTVDTSPNSLGIKYSGEPLEVNSVFEIMFKEPYKKREMTVVWSRPINRIMSAAGLRVTDRGSA
ncbi:MAG: response regulator [Thermodesulfobacteriota bacterium]